MRMVIIVNTFAKIRVQKKLGKIRQNYQSISIKSKRLFGISNPYTARFTLKKVIWISRREFLGLTVFAKSQTKESGTGKPSRPLAVKGLSNHPRKLAKVLIVDLKIRAFKGFLSSSSEG
jgi:hypothetical protein